MADAINLVQCRRGHKGLTVCTSCFGTGVVSSGTAGGHSYVKADGSAPNPNPDAHGSAVCQSCFGSGLLEPHSCFGSTQG